MKVRGEASVLVSLMTMTLIWPSCSMFLKHMCEILNQSVSSAKPTIIAVVPMNSFECGFSEMGVPCAYLTRTDLGRKG